MIRYFILIILITLSITQISAQATATLKGKVIDPNYGGEPIMFANLKVLKGGEMVAGGATDIDGNYNISNIPPGTYDVEITHIEYPILLVKGIKLRSGAVKTQDIEYNDDINLYKNMNSLIMFDSLPAIANDSSSYLILKIRDIYKNP